MAGNRVFTSIYIHDEDRVLLGLKKRGFAAGRWNGFGGKPNAGESLVDAARREVKEECALDVYDLNAVGILMFEFVGEAQLIEVHVYETSQYEGTVAESEEMIPQWYEKDDIPFNQMWPDNILWYPYIWKRVPFYGYFIFDGMDKIVSYTLKEVPSLESIDIPQGPQGASATSNVIEC